MTAKERRNVLTLLDGHVSSIPEKLRSRLEQLINEKIDVCKSQEFVNVNFVDGLIYERDAILHNVSGSERNDSDFLAGRGQVRQWLYGLRRGRVPRV